MGRRIARTAVVAGGAAYAGKKYGERKSEGQASEAEQEARIRELEAQQAAGQQPPPQAAAPASSSEDRIEQLKKLGELRDAGVLTEEEFASEKQKLL